MTKSERKTFVYFNMLIAVEGFIYLYYKYFKLLSTEYGDRPHELTSKLQHLHILLVPGLLVLFGYVLKNHVLGKLKLNNSLKKVSGITLLCVFGLMTISGYILQFGFDLDKTKMIGLLHIVISIFWVVMLMWHIRLRN